VEWKDVNMSQARKSALIIIDVQNGFCPGGNLPVPNGDEVVPTINSLISSGRYDLIVASKDWHPAGHGSFASSHVGKSPFEMGELNGRPQMMWPDHCIQNTHDAEFHPDLNTGSFDFVQLKGEDPSVDSYSAFRDNAADKKTGLDAYLRSAGITDIDICGLATDYCVKFSALDAQSMLPGVTVRHIVDASRGITAKGVSEAISDMKYAGIVSIRSSDVLKGN
jgi:nicotinamidase/pyrazinamidase